MLQDILQKLFKSDAKLVFKQQTVTAQMLVARIIEIINLLKTFNLNRNYIALSLPNSPELFCWQLACFHAGIPIVPIIYEYDVNHLDAVIKLTTAKLLITTSEKQQLLRQNNITLDCNINIINDEYQQILELKKQPFNFSIPSSTVKDEDLAMIIFSSGTSGKLKGIMHSYRSFAGFMQTLIEVLTIKEGLIYIVAQPMGHIGGISTLLITMLYQGTAILLQKFAIEEYMQLIDRYQPTHINLHTPLFYQVINYPQINKQGFRHISCCFAGGDSMPVSLPAQFYKATGAPMRVGYGMTEIGIVIINYQPYKDHQGAVGVKIKSAEIELRNEQNSLVAFNQPGQIWVKSPACCQGYFDDPELTKASIKDGWFATGDVAYQDKEGYFWYLGRESQIFYRNGKQIFPEKIENVIYQYPNIKAVAVINIKDQQEGEVPIAFVTLKKHSSDNTDFITLLKGHAKQYLSSLEIPKDILIVDDLPLNFTGKIDRQKLQSWYSDYSKSH